MIVVPVTEDDALEGDAVEVERLFQVQKVLGLTSVAGVQQNSAEEQLNILLVQLVQRKSFTVL